MSTDTRSGLKRQIVLAMAALALAVILLSVLGSYAFYAFFMTYSPSSISDSWLPNDVEIAWMLATTAAALAIAILAATRLSRRILRPLNSVAESLREVAEGNLQARAASDDPSLGEASRLVGDFNTMAERLQTMAEERRFWSAAIAHELRTPVTVLRGRLQGLTEGVFKPEPQLFESLLRQVEGLNRLIEDLRVLSLTDSGHLDLQRTPADLGAEIAAVVHAVDARLAARGFTLALDLELPAAVDCDPVRIRQALMALLENTLMHADPGPLRVRARLHEGWATLAVEDGGPGIPPELDGQLFEAFRRGEPSRSRRSGGSGLGLAIVKAIAEAHGGRVGSQALPSGGSSVWLSWPVSARAA
ncbi:MULTISPECIES: HAMP domain-containing sensor histidine kinase [Rubrivivax]|uniref:histidine kinase n=1 Tax=Rubrivivax benzoatilyticus TaxID=316997 RepID=A0ABX0I3N9_9BURK|nr:MULTISPECIES: HAMP domain-containing sensor histidine kinase [Rubrivivax]EGJ11012.1 integral membrane sensor signal transduction histidine kinase [Rubrivivax benzoatilyticus JA2 = ATCC BAA-35]MCC9597092.1 HAMP domain-containing protein [Rubrivivax sp. JA1055]MCC9646649.1 HAMP domain-containing protein [Rubrivivax sp. JA1029]NHL00210.1 HAMP domain-containing histidine kinase [Rubrivivax benzoatilyticus]NHL26011.1 HAMP domain-containing histidine kinase [Rubrivivax benzoatilyticus]